MVYTELISKRRCLLIFFNWTSIHKNHYPLPQMACKIRFAWKGSINSFEINSIGAVDLYRVEELGVVGQPFSLLFGQSYGVEPLHPVVLYDLPLHPTKIAISIKIVRLIFKVFLIKIWLKWAK